MSSNPVRQRQFNTFLTSLLFNGAKMGPTCDAHGMVAKLLTDIWLFHGQSNWITLTQRVTFLVLNPGYHRKAWQISWRGVLNPCVAKASQSYYNNIGILSSLLLNFNVSVLSNGFQLWYIYGVPKYMFYLRFHGINKHVIECNVGILVFHLSELQQCVSVDEWCEIRIYAY